MTTVERKPVVTLAALYGAGGTVVGPEVAERLGVPFFDRQIPDWVAERAGLPRDAVGDVDEGPRSSVDRLMSILGRASTLSGATEASAGTLDLEERRLRGYIEEVLARASTSGGVVLGRGGMIVLRDLPSATHVHLRGPREARLRQALAIEGLDHDATERRQRIEDQARIEYVRRAYGVNGEDPSLYHLILDSTALDLDTCADLIVAASRGRTHTQRPALVPE